MKKRAIIALISVVVIVASLTAAAFYRQSQTPNETKGKDTNAPKGSNTNTSVPQTYPVKVYFSKHPESDNDPTKVYGLNRNASTVAMGSFVINELITGPTESESKEGYFTPVVLLPNTSNCGAKDFMLAISDSVATLKFCKDFESNGVLSDARAQEAINASLLQFQSVKKVVILAKNGNCMFDASGQNLCLQ